MMGCVVLLGVCALSVREGWWTVLIEGLQLQQQWGGGGAALSNGEVLLMGLNSDAQRRLIQQAPKLFLIVFSSKIFRIPQVHFSFVIFKTI